MDRAEGKRRREVYFPRVELEVCRVRALPALFYNCYGGIIIGLFSLSEVGGIGWLRDVLIVLGESRGLYAARARVITEEFRNLICFG